MKIKVYKYKDGSIATSTTGRTYSGKANLDSSVGMEINKQKPDYETVVNAPDDLYVNYNKYLLRLKNKRLIVKRRKRKRRK